MLEASFPLWAQVGTHSAGGFQERLDLSAKPTNDQTSRVRLQARQTFCFSLAKRHGWNRADCDAIIQRGMDCLLNHCQRPDGLFGKQVELGVGLRDDRFDLYDTAFALLAFTAANQAGHAEAARARDALSGVIDDTLARPVEEGGFYETLPGPTVRQQNPHVHLFEASLAHYGACRDSAALARTQGIMAFVKAQFFCADAGTLCEQTTTHGSGLKADRLEAGHHYEWVWLLDWHARETGDALSPLAQPLYRQALALTDEAGRIALAHDRAGTVIEPIYRTWTQTEALRAHIAAYRRGWATLDDICKTFDLLWADHILPAPEGAWIDRVTRDGARDVDDITAATGYHIYGAFDALIAFAESLSE